MKKVIDIKKTVAFFVVFYTFFSTALYSQTYPAWFLFPRKNPSIHIGYCSSMYGEKNSKNEAASRYAVMTKCIVKGIFIRGEFTESDYIKDYDYYYYFDESDYEKYKSTFIAIDSVATYLLLKEYIVAFISDSADTTNINFERIDVSTIKKPQWVDKFIWKEQGYVYSVGQYSGKGNTNSSWKEAEERSMFQIAQDHQFMMYDVKVLSNDRIEKANAISIHTELQHIEIMERWIDTENEQCYVLARILQSNIKNSKSTK